MKKHQRFLHHRLSRIIIGLGHMEDEFKDLEMTDSVVTLLVTTAALSLLYPTEAIICAKRWL
jgi:hypothetical protein